MRIDR